MPSRIACKICGKLLVPPTGPDNSTVLVVGEFPGVDEVKTGVPFVGKVGEILRIEMQRAGMNLYSCRAANLWQHARGKVNSGAFANMDDKSCDIEWHKTQLIKEFKGKKYVLLMGSELTKMLFHKGVMELSGMEVPYDLFPKIRFFVSPIPPYLGPIGEFRLAMKRFTEAING